MQEPVTDNTSVYLSRFGDPKPTDNQLNAFDRLMDRAAVFLKALRGGDKMSEEAQAEMAAQDVRDYNALQYHKKMFAEASVKVMENAQNFPAYKAAFMKISPSLFEEVERLDGVAKAEAAKNAQQAAPEKAAPENTGSSGIDLPTRAERSAFQKSLRHMSPEAYQRYEQAEEVFNRNADFMRSITDKPLIKPADMEAAAKRDIADFEKLKNYPDMKFNQLISIHSMMRDSPDYRASMEKASPQLAKAAVEMAALDAKEAAAERAAKPQTLKM